MAGLPRSEVSFRRSGSSGLVWDDKLLSGELKPIKLKDEDEKEKGEGRSEPRPYRTVEVEPTIDPPSPKVSGCVCFGKPAKKCQPKKHKKGGVNPENKPADKKPAEENKTTVAEKAPVEKKPKAGKKLPKEGGAAAGDKKKKSVKTYKIYIFKLLKQVHPDIGISSKAHRDHEQFHQRHL